MKSQFFAGAAFVALVIPHAAVAQSTGTIDAEEIVVTGSRTRAPLQGIEVPDAPKARTVLNSEYISTQSAGQSILSTINIVPSVNFTNNDPFGSAGGNIRIRGFDGNRISLTFDGLPLNDTGNYAIFSNQQLDPEIIESVNVNQGTTDVDSPTAASSGGTINYRSLIPSEDLGGLVSASYGESYKGRSYHRVLGLIQTGDILGTGIRAYFSASSARADKFRGPGTLAKEQYNARLYKELGTNGDFISIAGHFNRNRNAAFRNNLTLAQATTDFRADGRFNFDNNPLCARPTFASGSAQNENATSQPSTAVPGALDTSCTNFFGVRLNPSNTGNARFNSKFSITDTVTFTLDAGYQYVLANGGGFTTLSETDPRARGYVPGTFAGGADLSGDTDTLDTVAFYTPNTTNTNRYTVLSSLRWDFSEGQYVRLAYAFDYGRHRQTGEWGYLRDDGTPENVFGGRGGARQALTNTGYFLRQRDRFSIAQLNQISGEYRGKFFDDALEVMVGVRAPFFRRELNQYCYTQASSGNPLCTNVALGTTPLVVPTNPASPAPPVFSAQQTNALNYLYVIPVTTAPAGQPANAVYAPFQQTYKYNKVLPNFGVTFRPAERFSIFAAYARGLSVPRTDNLYRAPVVDVQPETSDNFDIGVRYTSPMLQASFGGFYNRFQNRIVTSFDPVENISVDRNVGKVETKGLEASLNVRPFPWFSFNAFGSYIDAQYKDNVPASATVTLPLAGKKLVETPEWNYGYRAQVRFGPASLGANFKRVTSRFSTDLNDQSIPGYSTYDIDARVSLESFGLRKTFVQLNVNNLFDTQYLGSISTQVSTPTNSAGLVPGLATTATIPGGQNPTYVIAPPRSFVVSLQVGF